MSEKEARGLGLVVPACNLLFGYQRQVVVNFQALLNYIVRSYLRQNSQMAGERRPHETVVISV